MTPSPDLRALLREARPLLWLAARFLEDDGHAATAEDCDALADKIDEALGEK